MNPNMPPSGSSGDSGPVVPDRWAELEPLLDAVLDTPPELRASILMDLGARDPGLRAELERLVAECERGVPMLDRPAAEAFSRVLVEDGEPVIPEILGGRYRIEREIGRGGMACVYLARDLKHARAVAVKVIRPELAASLGRNRFLREIEIAASLRHPNIVPVYDSGDADGILYFGMPYEEGPSLRTRLEGDGALPVTQCVNILRDVARALAHAHEHGVVHRDVKPDNVMVSGGAAVVTDFGIAKAFHLAQSDAPAGTLTQPGAGLGTPAYMAPEQAVGDPATDHRADIYSFGCLAYELFAGHPPFHGLPAHKIIAAHVGTAPVPLSAASGAVPESIAGLVARCLAKSPADRPQSAQELLTDLDAAQTGPNELVRRRRRTPRAVLVTSVIVGGVLVVGAGYTMFRGRAAANAPREVTVAVLPLVSLGDSAQRDLAYGLSDEIATELVRVPGVRVMSRGGVASSRAQRDVDPERIGRELGAQFLVMGSLSAVSGQLTVLARLVRARDGAVLWADHFDRGMNALAALRDEIARAAGDSLRRIAGAPAAARAREDPRREPNPEAYRLYLLGQRALTLRGQRLQASVELFKRATELDTAYADAFSGLSLALALSPYFEQISTREVSGAVRSAAARALRLDPTLAPPHVALGLVHQFAYQWDSAAAELQTALRLHPDDIEALVQYGRYMLHTGRTSDALQLFLTARRTEPASALVSSWLAQTYLLRGQIDSASLESARAFQSDSTNYTTLYNGSWIRFKAGDSAGARDFAARLSRFNAGALRTFAALGDTATALGRLRELESVRPPRWLAATTRAYVMFAMGDTTAAMAALDKATDANELWPAYAPVIDPMYDAVRSSARFHDLLRRVNLPVNEATTGQRSQAR